MILLGLKTMLWMHLSGSVRIDTVGALADLQQGGGALKSTDLSQNGYLRVSYARGAPPLIAETAITANAASGPDGWIRAGAIN